MRKAIRCAMVLLVVGGYAYAGDCRLESSSCVDSTASKTISGVVVTLTDVGGCWEYQDTYTCIKPNSIDYCSALTAAGCGQTSSVCSDTAFNGTCNTYTKTFRCGNNQGTPTNTVRLDNTYSLVTDTANTSQCSSYAQTRDAAWRRMPAWIPPLANSIPVGRPSAWPVSHRPRAD